MKGKFDYMQLPNHIQFETVSQATKLLEKRRILYEVHEALEQQKESIEELMLFFDRKIQHDDMQASLIKKPEIKKSTRKSKV